MSFDLARMLRLWARSILGTRGTHARLTPRRVLFLALFIPLSVLAELINWSCLLLDEILFPAHRRIEVREPVFIIGTPRSGSTFLHRLLERDRDRFTALHLWEIFLAPSIVQKRLYLAVRSLDRIAGGLLRRLVEALDRRVFGRLAPIHRSSLFESEEDALILIHRACSIFLMGIYPFEDEMRPFTRFDTELAARERRRILSFYRGCVQRHLHVFGPHRQLLSKNPSFSPAVRSLLEVFPDARLVCLLRSPLEVLPSETSLIAHLLRIFCSPLDPCPMRDFVVDFLGHWYRYPVGEIEQSLDPARHQVLTYPELMSRPREVVEGLYARFGYEITPGFRRVLEAEAGRVAAYRSRHSYSLEQVGLDPGRVYSAFADVIERHALDDGRRERGEEGPL